MSFNLPTENYWNDNEQLTEIRTNPDNLNTFKGWSNYRVIVLLYENGKSVATSLITQYVYKKGKLSEKQLTLFTDMILFPMLYVTDEYRYKRQEENRYISINPTKRELKLIEKNRAEFGD